MKKKKLAIKIWRFSVRRKGVWGEPGFVVVVVVKPKTRTFRIAKKGQVAKKMKRPTTAGARVGRAQRL